MLSPILTLLLIYACFISIVSSTVNISCEFKSMTFNHTKDILTCIPKQFIVENSTDYAQMSTVHLNCEAFFVKNSDSMHLPLGLSNFLPNLTIFHFIESNLTEIHQDSLENLTHLAEVSFYKNLLTKIKVGIFEDNKLIRKISFGANKIAFVDADVFRGLKDLREIYLNDNELENLDAELFRDNQKLFLVDLELNKLKTLPMTIFNGLGSLNFLNLNNNDLEALPGRIFTNISSLEVLKFSQNFITKTDIQNMDFFDILTTIDVSDNPCTDVLRYTPEMKELKEFLDENCKVECEDKLEWIKTESEEKTRKYERVLQELENFKFKESKLISAQNSLLMSIDGNDSTTFDPKQN